MKNQKENPEEPILNIYLPNKVLVKIIEDTYFQNSMQKLEDVDVNLNHLENIFTDKTYYMAMKLVPLLERKVLYLSYIENLRLNDICRRLKLSKSEVISIRNKGIRHFKNNLLTLFKAERLGKGGNEEWTKTKFLKTKT